MAVSSLTQQAGICSSSLYTCTKPVLRLSILQLSAIIPAFILVLGNFFFISVVIIFGQSYVLALVYVSVISAILPMALIYESVRGDFNSSSPIRLAISRGIALAPVSFGLAILMSLGIEFFISFKGAGVPPPTPSLGSMLSEGRYYLANAWWPVFPLAILILAAGGFFAIAFPVSRIQDRIRTATQAEAATISFAGFWRRLGAAVIDYFVISELSFVGPGIMIIALMGLEGFVAQFLSLLWVIVIPWLYFAGLEASNKQSTLGKDVFGIKVTDLEGNKVSFWQATGRHFGKFASALILGIGFFIMLFTEKKQALHDKMAGCLVVRK